jgi:hypothetical protein
MTREDLIKKVALKMDEISSSDDVILSVGSSDNNPLYVQINNLLNESVNDVLMKAPVYRIQSHIVSTNNVKVEDIFGGMRKVAVITVPDEFIKFVSVTDKLFQREITEVVMQGDDKHKRQQNKFLVAKYAKPVAVLTNTAGVRKIVCYSYDVADTPRPMLYYVERYEGDESKEAEVTLDGYMIDVVTWVCAGKVFAAQGDVNKGKLCDDNAASLMI